MASSKSFLVQCLLSSLFATTSLSVPTSRGPLLASRTSCPSGGQSYVVKANDTCNALAIQYSTSTDNVIAVNSLNDNCTNLIAGSTICIPPPCNTYLVAAGDTCATVAKAHNLTTDQFFDHNPGIDSPNCSNLKIGQNVCLDQAHGSQFPIPVTSSSATASAAMPTGTSTSTSAGSGSGSPPSCSKTYTAVSGDNCYKIAAQGGINLVTLQQLNPTIIDATNTCPNIMVGQSYCLAKAGVTGTNTSVNNPSGMSASCNRVYTAVAGDVCWKIAAQGGIDLLALEKLNPGIDDPTNTCPNIIVGAKYCLAGPGPYGGSIGNFVH